jgi:hypothetical protein
MILDVVIFGIDTNAQTNDSTAVNSSFPLPAQALTAKHHCDLYCDQNRHYHGNHQLLWIYMCCVAVVVLSKIVAQRCEMSESKEVSSLPTVHLLTIALN